MTVIDIVTRHKYLGDHKQGLCGKPDLEDKELGDLWDISLCVPIRCKCCGSNLTGPNSSDPADFYLICSVCPSELQTTGMSSKKIGEALIICRKCLESLNVPIRQHPDHLPAISNDSVLAHCHWMTIEAEDFLAKGRREKAMRWLCFVQGCIFTLRHFCINEMKDHNRPDAAN